MSSLTPPDATGDSPNTSVPGPFDYQPATRVVYGAGALSRLGELARELGGRRVLLVTDRHLVAAGHVARAVQSLDGSGLVPAVLDEVQENPTTRDVDGCLAFARSADIDFIVGLGGGSRTGSELHEDVARNGAAGAGCLA